MYGQPIEEVFFEKDLGVVFSNDMKVSLQCRESYSKANRMLGLINRTIRYKHPTVINSLQVSRQTTSRVLLTSLESIFRQRHRAA